MKAKPSFPRKRESRRNLLEKNVLYADIGGSNTHVWFNKGYKLDSRFRGNDGAQKLIAGIRGVWTAAEKKFWKKRLKPFAATVEILSDIELHHRRIFGTKPGIVLNAGTGSIAYGRRNGRSARAGGLGPLIGDEGSAFWIGREYIKRVLVRKKDIRRLRSYLAGPSAVANTAGLAKKVLTEAGRRPQSEPGRIIKEAQNHLVALVKTVEKKLNGAEKAPIALVGGLFRNSGFRNGLIDRLSK